MTTHWAVMHTVPAGVAAMASGRGAITAPLPAGEVPLPARGASVRGWE